jgi:uncharacterized repeat protein (TIGR01451 family)
MDNMKIRIVPLIIGCFAPFACAQAPIHYFQSAHDPPGSIGQLQVQHRATLRDYVQPVEIHVPEMATVAVVGGGELSEAFQSRAKIGIPVGDIYRLKVAEIPHHPGVALYPTIEVINRLHPPAGLAEKFPVPVRLSQRDLEHAIAGRLLVRVLYLENPARAYPEAEDPLEQRVTMALPGEDPLHLADELGRPMAILRIGSRIPDDSGTTDALFGGPFGSFARTHATVQPVGYETAVEESSPPCFVQVQSGLGDTPDGCPIPNCGPGVASCETTPNPRPHDEYICDGGDAQVYVTVSDDWKVRGLDAEDTVGHFDTLDGRTLVQSSNRVCIYAPRLAAVDQLTGLHADVSVTEVGQAISPAAAAVDQQRESHDAIDQPVAPRRNVAYLAPLVFRDRTRAVAVDRLQRVREMRNLTEAYQDLQVMRWGVFDQSERALLAERTEAALIWTEAQAPEVLLDALPAIADVTLQKPAIAYHVDDSGLPQLRLLKIASASAALPGEEIEFSLRFDNVGDQPIGNVTIIDNLMSRLEFVAGSAACDRKAEFHQDLNAAESLTLRWEITEPLRPGEGGVIRFRCIVR